MRRVRIKVVGLVDSMRPRHGSVQIDRGESGSGGFGALRAPATILTDSQGFVGCSQQTLLLFGKEITFPLSISGHPVPKSSPSFSAALRSSSVNAKGISSNRIYPNGGQWAQDADPSKLPGIDAVRDARAPAHPKQLSGTV